MVVKCAWWLNPNKTQSMIVSRSRTVFPPQSDLLVGSTSLNSRDSFKILGVLFDSKFTFEKQILSISSLVAQKIDLLRKPFRVFGDHDVLLRCFNSFILPCLKYCSLFGPLQLIPILNFLIRIYKLVNSTSTLEADIPPV